MTASLHLSTIAVTKLLMLGTLFREKIPLAHNLEEYKIGQYLW